MSVSLSMVLVLPAAGGGRRPVAEPEPPPATVVGQYLRALQAGDTHTALGYATPVRRYEASDDLLVPEAMSRDWTLTRVVTRYQDDDAALVDVTLAAADGTTREGRFALAHLAERGWAILNPLVKVDFSWLPMRYTDLNGVTTQARMVWLFPGVYDAFTTAGLLRVGAPTYVVVPIHSPATSDGRSTAAPRRYLPAVELTEAGLDRLHDQLGDWFDRCAATGLPFPPGGCPFSTGDRDEATIHLLADEYEADGASLSWQVVTYPQVRLAQTHGAFIGHLMAPGQLRVTGTAQPRYRDGGPEAFESDCTARLRDLQVTLPNPGTFQFQVDNDLIGSACGRGQYYLD